jgi:hypothetical protein
VFLRDYGQQGERGEGGGEWPGPLDCADKNGSSCERGAEPAVP